jgi:hypothetical protein
VTRIEDQKVWLRWDVGVWTQEPGGPATRVDPFDIRTLTNAAGRIRARILAPEEGVPVPAEPVVPDETDLARWPYIEPAVAVADYPCTVPGCHTHSTAKPFDAGRELLFWLGAALPGFDCRSDLYLRMAARLSYASRASRPEGLPRLDAACGAFAFTHVPLVEAAEFAAMPGWTVSVELEAPTLAQLQGLAQDHPDEGVLVDLDVRPVEDLGRDDDVGFDTSWHVRVTNVYDLTELDALAH